MNQQIEDVFRAYLITARFLFGALLLYTSLVSPHDLIFPGFGVVGGNTRVGFFIDFVFRYAVPVSGSCGYLWTKCGPWLLGEPGLSPFRRFAFRAHCVLFYLVGHLVCALWQKTVTIPPPFGFSMTSLAFA